MTTNPIVRKNIPSGSTSKDDLIKLAHKDFIQSFRHAATLNLNDSLHYLLYNRPTDIHNTL